MEKNLCIVLNGYSIKAYKTKNDLLNFIHKE